MTEYKYHFTDIKPTSSEVFAEATEAELRVLVALIDAGGSATDEELLSLSGVSKARLGAGIALWEEAGVIAEGEIEREVGAYRNTVTSEYEYDPLLEDLDEEDSKTVAATIRKNKLRSLYEEIQSLLGREALTPLETKKIAGLVSQYGLTEEYILTLAAHMHEYRKLTVSALVTRIKGLVEKGTTTVEELEIYISGAAENRGKLGEYIRIFSTGERKLSKAEREFLRKWSEDYAYGTPVVSLAYDLSTLSIGKLSFAYMDKIITDWHENGAKTLEECEARYMEFRRTLAEESEKKRETLAEKTSSRRPKKEKPRYGDFDAEEALKQALSRSFFDEDGGKEN